MSEHDNTSDQYEYVPMSVPYNDVAIGYGFGEGVGFNASGGLRGHVVIHAYSSREVSVSVFSNTGVKRLAPNSFIQGKVTLVRGGQVLSTQMVKKDGAYAISEYSKDSYVGSATLTLPIPLDLTPVDVSIIVFSQGTFYEGTVPGTTQKVTIPIAVQKVSRP